MGVRRALAIAGVWAALSAGMVGAAPAPGVRVTGVKLGLGSSYKIGSWAPVLVHVDARPNGFVGSLHLRMADSDDATAVTPRPIHLPAGPVSGARTLMSYVKPGSGHGSLDVALRDARGALVASYELGVGSGLTEGLHQEQKLIVSVGPAAGLRKLLTRKAHLERYDLAELRTVEELPRRWYGYEAADWVVWTTGDEGTTRRIVRRLGDDQKQALVEWVRRGGRLVLSVGRRWEEVTKSFLADLLPEPLARLEPAVEVDGLPANFGGRRGLPCAVLRSYNVPNPRLVVRPIHWRIQSETAGLPLVVSYTCGFGEVVLLCFDVDRVSPDGESGAQKLWQKLLSVQVEESDDMGAGATRLGPGRVTQRDITDLASPLKANLDHFESVKPIPFTLVALLSFVYILLIGPVDYLLLKKVLRRMELTWVTFTVMVVGVSVLAYYVAYAVKGRHMRVNQIDVVDVNVADRTIRGTSWFTLFSPANDRLSLSLDRPNATMSWLGKPEAGFGGMYRMRSGAMLQGEYAYGPQAASLVNVPVAIWSTKSATASWYGEWGRQFSSKLVARPGGFAARGTVTNRWGADLEDAVVAYARRVYFVGRLRQGQTVALESLRSRNLSSWLERQAGFSGGKTEAVGRMVDRFDPDAARTDADEVMRLMMFFSRVPRRYLTQSGSSRIANAQFRSIDLSGHLDHGYAILVGRAQSGGPTLAIDRWSAAKVHAATYVRAIMPVAKGARAE